jgi:hypothetical protein
MGREFPTKVIEGVLSELREAAQEAPNVGDSVVQSQLKVNPDRVPG